MSDAMKRGIDEQNWLAYNKMLQNQRIIENLKIKGRGKQIRRLKIRMKRKMKEFNDLYESGEK